MGHDPEKAADIRKQFSDAGFEVEEAAAFPGSIAVKKYNCLQYLGTKPDQAWHPQGPPYFMIRGLNYELEDRGYQKFWHRGGARLPIRKADLEALHRFDEEVREMLGWPSLYHQSLGSTCARTVYDRLQYRLDK